MPAITAGKRLPYPLGTDRLMDGDDSIRKLAQSVDNMVQSGTVTVPITALGTTGTAAVTFPVAYSSGTGVVVVTETHGVEGLTNLFSNTGTPSAAGVTIQGAKTTGTVANMTVRWIAVGPVATVA